MTLASARAHTYPRIHLQWRFTTFISNWHRSNTSSCSFSLPTRDSAIHVGCIVPNHSASGRSRTTKLRRARVGCVIGTSIEQRYAASSVSTHPLHLLGRCTRPFGRHMVQIIFCHLAQERRQLGPKLLLQAPVTPGTRTVQGMIQMAIFDHVCSWAVDF